MEGNNIQKAGNNSNQNQYTNCNFVVGITEERAREIIKEENKVLIASYNEIAWDIAMTRSKIIEEKIISKLVKEELLEELKKPENLVAIQDTVRQAICTDDEKSYELLSKLLSNRIKYSNDRLIASSLKNATEVATEITDEALLGLTVFFLMDKYIPTSAGIKQGLKTLDDMFGIMDLNNLPNGKVWIEQLDILKLARINSFGKMSKVIEYYSKLLNGYVCVGIKKNSEKYKEAVGTLEKAGLLKSDLMIHELNEEYVRLPLVIEKTINNIGHYTVKGDFVPLSLDQQHAYEVVNELYEKNETVLNANREQFSQMWDQFPNLLKVRNWWDKIETSFTVTIVGLVLAYTNINNISKNIDLPKMKLKDLVS